VSSTAKEPVTKEKIAGTDLTRMKLEPLAAERMGLRIEPVKLQTGPEGEPGPMTVPYGALLYDAKGTTFVYTNPEPLTFVRHPVEVDFVEGDTAVLRTGPPPSTLVVTVGSAELVGIEFGVGK
jgi:hypothetical protein